MRSGSVTPARGGRAVMDRSARPSGTHPRIAVLAGLRRVRHTPMGSERPAGRGPSALEASAGAAHAGVSEPRRSTVMMWSGYYDGWSWLLMAAMMVLLWGGVAALIAVAARAMIGPRGSDQAMDTLRRRLASGEITQEEFETIRRALQGSDV